jgi:hypothetical protein
MINLPAVGLGPLSDSWILQSVREASCTHDSAYSTGEKVPSSNSDTERG